MAKQLFNHKSLEKQHREAISKLPINDSKAVEDVRIYASMSEEELNKLPAFEENGDFKYYSVGDVLLGKLSLIQFVKSIKNK
jgi:hypothetical protein